MRRYGLVRGKVHGTAARPGLAVCRSNKHLVLQVNDGEAGRTIAAAFTDEPGQRATGIGGSVAGTSRIGQLVAERAKFEARIAASTADLPTQVKAQLDEVKVQVAKAAAQAEAAFEPVQKEIDLRLDKVEEALPAQVKVVVQQARAAAKDAQAQLKAALAA